jgi:hypothetical protein
MKIFLPTHPPITKAIRFFYTLFAQHVSTLIWVPFWCSFTTEKNLSTICEIFLQTHPGTDVIIFKIFSTKHLAKILAFFAQTTASFCKKL